MKCNFTYIIILNNIKYLDTISVSVIIIKIIPVVYFSKHILWILLFYEFYELFYVFYIIY